MSKVEHKRPSGGRGAKLGELLILLGILFLGMALSVPVETAVGSRQSVAGETEAPTPADVAPMTSLAAPLVESLPVPSPAPDVPPTEIPAGGFGATTTVVPPERPPVMAALQPALAPTAPSFAATRIAIPSVGIDAKVVDVGYQVVTIEGQTVRQLQVADYAAGHDAMSSNPGAGGNIVIAGHDDWRGEVFKNLHEAKLGDQVLLTTPEVTHRYVITEIIYRQDVDVPLADRLAAGQFLAPMPEERLTLVTCWPYGVDTQRLIVVAKPL